MQFHQLWHIVLLAATLFAAAGAAILLLSPLVFDRPPPGLVKYRPTIVTLIVVTGAMLVVEWLVVHGRSL